MGNAEPEMDESLIQKLAPVCLGVVQKLYPDNDQHPTIETLAPIWDEVVQRIIDEMTALDLADEVALHINIREEMVMELVRLQFWLAERVIEKRIGGRTLLEIDAEREQEECLERPTGAAIAPVRRFGRELRHLQPCDDQSLDLPPLDQVQQIITAGLGDDLDFEEIVGELTADDVR